MPVQTIGQAAEGATGPRKRSGTQDRPGIKNLWKDGRRKNGRTDGVRTGMLV